jgi:hypothetical protein
LSIKFYVEDIKSRPYIQIRPDPPLGITKTSISPFDWTIMSKMAHIYYFFSFNTNQIHSQRAVFKRIFAPTEKFAPSQSWA